MAITVAALKKLHLYYSVLRTYNPTPGLAITTWVYVEEKDRIFYFSEWHTYRLAIAQNDMKLMYVREFKPEKFKGHWYLEGLVSRHYLNKEIKEISPL